MGLSDTRDLINKALPYLNEVAFTASKQSSGTFYKYVGLSSLTKALTVLSESYEFVPLIRAILESPLKNFSDDKATIPATEHKQIQAVLRDLRVAVELTHRLLKSSATEGKQDSVFIRLPDIKDLDELSKRISNFSKILSQTIINDKINGQIVLEAVEGGSVWLKLWVGSPAAVVLIGSLAWASAVVYKKYQEAKYLEQVVREKSIQNDSKFDLKEANEKIINLMIEAEATNLYNHHFDSAHVDQEQFKRLVFCIKLLSEEIGKGSEVHPELTAPEEVKNLFPDLKNLPSIESKIRRIENKD